MDNHIKHILETNTNFQIFTKAIPT